MQGRIHGPEPRLDPASALQALDPGVGRETWVRILTAAKAAGICLEDAVVWSSRAENFAGAKDVQAVWKSIGAEGAISAGTLYYLARQAGWRGTSTPAAQRKQARSRQQEPTSSSTRNANIPAGKLWNSFEPALASHPYIAAKQGSPHGLRVVPETCARVVAGQRLAGCLAVPVSTIGSTTPCSIQFIPAPGHGQKLNLPGAPMDGIFVVGDLAESADHVYIVEGIGQAWACSMTTGCPAVVAFGSGRQKFITIIADLNRLLPMARPVLVADRGMEQLADDIALATKCSLVCMPEHFAKNEDISDLWLRHGDEAVQARLSSAQTPALRYKLLRGSDLLALPPLRWCVRDVLPAAGVAAMFGASGAGKSFLVLDLAAAIAEGTEWCGHKVRQTAVVYVALEGQGGFQLRARAWVKHNQRNLPDGIRFVLQQFDLGNSSDVADLSQAVNAAGRHSVVILDTLNAAAPTIDENASAGMGVVLRAAKDLQQQCAGLVLLVHHSGKDAARGLRGHSSLLGALDASIEVTRDSDVRQWRIAKAKDGADGLTGRFELKPIDLGRDDEGEPWSSCAVVHGGTGGISPPKLLLGGGGTHQRVAMDTLRPMFCAARDKGMASAPPGRPCIELRVAIAAVGPRLVCDVGRRTERAGQAIAGLAGKGALAHDSGWLWLP